MGDDVTFRPYRVAIIALDSHAAGPVARVSPRLAQDFSGLSVEVFAAGEWSENTLALAQYRAAVAQADLIVVNLLFIEEHLNAILPALQARRDKCDAMFCLISDGQIVKLTKMGDLDMSKPDPGQGAGPARLVFIHAVLAGRVGREYRTVAAVPVVALCNPCRLAWRAVERAD